MKTGKSKKNEVKENEVKKRRNRAPKDIVHKVQAWAWCAGVRARRPEHSLPTLDDLIFGEKRELRAMWRVQREGHSPDRADLRGFSMVDAADLLPGFEGTAAVFRSLLWKLLDVPIPTVTQTAAIRDELYARYDLFQADQMDFLVAGYNFKRWPFVRSVEPEEFCLHLEQLELQQVPVLDVVALAGVHYRLALANAELEFATALRIFIRNKIRVASAGLGLDDPPNFPGTYLSYLVEMRLLRLREDITPSTMAKLFASAHVAVQKSLHPESSTDSPPEPSDIRLEERSAMLQEMQISNDIRPVVQSTKAVDELVHLRNKKLPNHQR